MVIPHTHMVSTKVSMLMTPTFASLDLIYYYHHHHHIIVFIIIIITTSTTSKKP